MPDLHNHLCTHPPRQSSSAPSPYLPYLGVRFTMRLSGPPQYGLIAAGGRATSVSAKSLGVCFGTTPAYLIKPPPESDDSLVPTRNRRIILLSERERGRETSPTSHLSSLISRFGHSGFLLFLLFAHSHLLLSRTPLFDLELLTIPSVFLSCCSLSASAPRTSRIMLS
jgi:hypothetical protein